MGITIPLIAKPENDPVSAAGRAQAIGLGLLFGLGIPMIALIVMGLESARLARKQNVNAEARYRLEMGNYEYQTSLIASNPFDKAAENV